MDPLGFQVILDMGCRSSCSGGEFGVQGAGLLLGFALVQVLELSMITLYGLGFEGWGLQFGVRVWVLGPLAMH